YEEVEAGPRVGAPVLGGVDVEGRAPARVDAPPALPPGEPPGHLAVQGERGHVVAEADLDVGPEPERAHERPEVGVAADGGLVGGGRRAPPAGPGLAGPGRGPPRGKGGRASSTTGRAREVIRARS